MKRFILACLLSCGLTTAIAADNAPNIYDFVLPPGTQKMMQEDGPVDMNYMISVMAVLTKHILNHKNVAYLDTRRDVIESDPGFAFLIPHMEEMIKWAVADLQLIMQQRYQHDTRYRRKAVWFSIAATFVATTVINQIFSSYFYWFYSTHEVVTPSAAIKRENTVRSSVYFNGTVTDDE